MCFTNKFTAINIVTIMHQLFQYKLILVLCKELNYEKFQVWRVKLSHSIGSKYGGHMLE